MEQLDPEARLQAATFERAGNILAQHHLEIHRRTDRLFAYLMVIQWLLGIGTALWISPWTWNGNVSSIHVHVWAAIFLGGLITSFPVFLVLTRPGSTWTRQSIAVGQMLTSALLIHLTGGRIETHFHVFGSLAFLACYRDWRVLLTATLVVSADHLLRGMFWSQSVFGVLSASHWRWLEHAGWVIFENIFLVISMFQSLKEMSEVALRRAKLEAMNESFERGVEQRTRELQEEIQERINTQLKLEETHQQLMQASRQAGMAEVATGVLHNVGNVLNSVNVSAILISDHLQQTNFSGLRKVNDMLSQQAPDLGRFFQEDPRAKQLPGYLSALADHMAGEKEEIAVEVQSLRKNIEHIKEIVAMQQSYSKVSGISQTISIEELVEDSLRINAEGLSKHSIQVVRQFEAVPHITTDKHKVVQILVNLISNAKNACREARGGGKRMTVRIAREPELVNVSVTDNGVGIPNQNLTRIFSHGFTTRMDGHGFGLHTGALAAKELGGSLTAHSEGEGEGATFVLSLPLASVVSEKFVA